MNQRQRKPAVSAIVGIIIGVAITAGLGGTVYTVFTDQTAVFTSTTTGEIRNANAVVNGDRITITATIKNTGQTTFDDAFISEVSFDGVVVSLDSDGGDDSSVLYSQINTATDTFGTAITLIHDEKESDSKLEATLANNPASDVTSGGSSTLRAVIEIASDDSSRVVATYPTISEMNLKNKSISIIVQGVSSDGGVFSTSSVSTRIR